MQTRVIIPRSPIEAMIDKATGYDASKHLLTDPIRCDICHKHRRVFIMRSKPHRILCAQCLRKERR